jgi:ubiquinone biosynthesis protein
VKPESELDAAGRDAGRALWVARLLLREAQISFWLTVALLALPLYRVRRGSMPAAIGASIAFLFRRLGATFIKIGQIMSTRPDIFPASFLEPIEELQDRVPPFPFTAVRRTLEEDFGRPLEALFVEFGSAPVASASVAQVHRAVLADGRVVAVKVRRPAIVRRAVLDEAVLRIGARLVALIPTAKLISPVEAAEQFCHAVNQQLDFRLEAANNRRFRRNFADDPHVVFPELVDELCTDRVLTMDFIEGVKEAGLEAIGNDPRFLARKGMEIICRMIYHHGFVHADLHPGNFFWLPGNRVALVDLGLIAELDDESRRKIALVNFYMIAGMGPELARVFYDEAEWRDVPDYAAYEADVADFVARIHGRPIEELQITLLIGEIFNLLRRHRIRARATYTVVNIALMVVEGLGRKLDPTLNPSIEARPWLESALSAPAST